MIISQGTAKRPAGTKADENHPEYGNKKRFYDVNDKSTEDWKPGGVNPQIKRLRINCYCEFS